FLPCRPQCWYGKVPTRKHSFQFPDPVRGFRFLLVKFVERFSGKFHRIERNICRFVQCKHNKPDMELVSIDYFEGQIAGVKRLKLLYRRFVERDHHTVPGKAFYVCPVKSMPGMKLSLFPSQRFQASPLLFHFLSIPKQTISQLADIAN